MNYVRLCPQDTEIGDIITLSHRCNLRNDIILISIDLLIDIVSGEYKPAIRTPFDRIDIVLSINTIRSINDHNLLNILKLNNLPVVYINGLFMDWVKADNLKASSRYICLDLDDYDFSQAANVWEKLVLIPYVKFIFSSPSRREKMKIVIEHDQKYDPSSESILDYTRRFSRMYDTIMKEVLSIVGVKFDSNCKDLARATFLSVGLLYNNKDNSVYKYIDRDTSIDKSYNKPIYTPKIEESKTITYILKEPTEYTYKNQTFKIHDINKAIFHYVFTHNNIKFNYNELGHKRDWIFRTSQELFKYIDDVMIVIDLYKDLYSQEINLFQSKNDDPRTKKYNKLTDLEKVNYDDYYKNSIDPNWFDDHIKEYADYYKKRISKLGDKREEGILSVLEDRFRLRIHRRIKK